MSLLDDVSIVVTPNGYKAGELYAVVPVPTEGSELLTDGDFANDLDDWSKYGVTSATGGVATIGASANSGIYQTILTEGIRYTVTINVTSYDGVGLAQVTNGNGTVLYLITETGIQTFTFISAIASGQLIIRGLSNALFSVSNVSVKEYTSADMDVTRATDATRVDENGLIEDVLSNVPRIDYTGGGCPHILAEPQRTNLFEYSESFNESEWSRTSVTVVDNSSQSPDGTNNASLLYPSSSGDYRYMHNSTTASSSTYTISAFVKASGKNVVWFYINSASNNGFIYYDLSDQTTQVVAGSVGTPTATIISYGNDWYKISFTTGTAVALASGSGIGVSDAKGDPAVTTNGTDGVLVWGLQLEAGSYATSYIPTSGSTVTRNQDIFTRDGIGSLINSTEGVLFLEASTFENGADCRITLSDGTITNRVSIEWDILANTIKGFVGSDGNLVSPATYNQTNSNKIALKYKENDCALWINGTEVDTDFSVSALSGTNQLEFSNYGGVLPFEGKVKQLQVYDTALTDTQLAALTS